MKKKNLFLALSTCFIGLSSCVNSNDVTGSSTVEQLKSGYADSFPVQNVDPLMDWKTTQKVTLNVAVNETNQETYTIQVYDGNPIDEAAKAKQLAYGYAGTNLVFNTSFDCPIDADTIYVSCMDALKRRLVKPAAIVGKTSNVTFGATTLQSKRAVTAAKAGTWFDAPYTTDQLNKMLSSATELTVNAKLAEKGVYKVTQELSGISLSGKAATIIVTNKLISSGTIKIPNGTQIIVMNGAYFEANKVEANSSFKLTVLEGGKASISDYTTNQLLYNAGELNLGMLTLNETTLFNLGTLNVESKVVPSSNNKENTIVNYGHFKVATQELTATSVENYCYLEIAGAVGDFTTDNLIMGAGSYLETKDITFVNATLAENSIIVSRRVESNNTAKTILPSCDHIIGPTSGYALMKLDNINNCKKDASLKGNIYCEIADTKPHKNFLALFEGSATSAITAPGEAPLTIAADNCTKGNQPATTGGGVDPNEATLQNYSYAFEDNYPDMGDYDFNDVVFDVTSYNLLNSKNQLEGIKYTLTLSAVGATKTLGAALRFVGIDANLIGSVTFEGDHAANFQNTIKSSMFNTDESNELIYPIFGDAHMALTDSKSRILYNTGIATVPTRSVDLIVRFKTAQSTVPITKDNLDLFIAYGNKPIGRTEIHLLEFRNKPTSYARSYDIENEAAANYTWAISVPYFNYPIEYVKITKAFSKFKDWATDRTSNLDWYKYPETGYAIGR